MKMCGEEPISLDPVIELIVMYPGIDVFVPVEILLSPVHPKERRHVFINIGFNQRRPEAATIHSVMHQQGWFRRAHGNQFRKVKSLHEIRRILFYLVSVSWGGKIRFSRSNPGHLYTYRNAGIQGGEQNCLPTTPGKPRNADARGIHFRRGRQIVQTASHRQVKQA